MNRTTSIASAMVVLLVLAATNSFAGDNNVTVSQGGVGRWSAAAAKECGIFGRRYPAIDGVCYYPVDMKAKPGVHEIAMWDVSGARTLGTLAVTRRQCGRIDVSLDGGKFVEISDEEKKKGAAERARIADAAAGTDKQPAFALPLGPAAAGVENTDRSDFCELRVYNNGRVRSRHTGLDFPLPRGTPVVAVANGKVVLAEEHFYTGNTVVVDHGGGLTTMMFHLDDIAVEPGSTVVRGDPIGTVGSTGRSTGPHLHLGARYQNQRIDVGALLGDPASLPGVAEAAPAPIDGTTGGALPSEGTVQGEANPSSDVMAPASDPAAVDTTPVDAVDAESDEAGKPDEDVLEKEAEEQQKADEAARSR